MNCTEMHLSPVVQTTEKFRCGEIIVHWYFMSNSFIFPKQFQYQITYDSLELTAERLLSLLILRLPHSLLDDNSSEKFNSEYQIFVRFSIICRNWDLFCHVLVRSQCPRNANNSESWENDHMASHRTGKFTFCPVQLHTGLVIMTYLNCNCKKCV